LSTDDFRRSNAAYRRAKHFQRAFSSLRLPRGTIPTVTKTIAIGREQASNDFTINNLLDRTLARAMRMADAGDPEVERLMRKLMRAKPPADDDS